MSFIARASLPVLFMNAPKPQPGGPFGPAPASTPSREGRTDPRPTEGTDVEGDPPNGAPRRLLLLLLAPLLLLLWLLMLLLMLILLLLPLLLLVLVLVLLLLLELV